jgi:cysteinyl-tRNA synthetase
VLQLHNTLTGQKEPFVPLVPGKVAMYHCGPTVYSSPHIGNFRSFLLGDLLRRFLEDQGYAVTQVMNVTDVGHLTADDEDRGEDRMELAARREKLDPWAIARKYEAEFVQALRDLHFRMPHRLPRATEHIAEMGAIIDDLLARGVAYQVNGNVYFEIAKFPGYGKLSKKPLDELEEGARVAVNPEKKDPRDFALWKVDPKHLMQWDAPFRGGVRGFPGWHIECSAMSMKYLGPSFDVHTGGEDNLFPHHECEVAQSEAHTGRPFVRTWLHVKHLLVEGQKMSKSLGNFTTVKDVLDRGFSGAELRYALLRAQYRQTLNFTWAGLEDGRKAIQRVQNALSRLQRIAAGEEPAGSADLAGPTQRADAGFTASLDDDLNVSEALAAVFEFVSAVNKVMPTKEAARAALARFARFDCVLGCFGVEAGGIGVPVGGGETKVGGEPELQQLLDRRQAARKAKDWATADAMRDELARRGFRIVDTPQGPRLEKA